MDENITISKNNVVRIYKSDVDIYNMSINDKNSFKILFFNEEMYKEFGLTILKDMKKRNLINDKEYK